MKRLLTCALTLSLMLIPIHVYAKSKNKKKDNQVAIYVLTKKTDNDIDHKVNYPHQTDSYTYNKNGLVKTHIAMFYRCNRENYRQMYFYKNNKIIRMVKSTPDDRVLWKNIKITTEADHYHNISYKNNLIDTVVSDRGKNHFKYKNNMLISDTDSQFEASYTKKKLTHIETLYATADLGYDNKGHINNLVREDHDNDDSYYYVYKFKNTYKKNRLIHQNGTPIINDQLDNSQDTCYKRIDYNYKKIKVKKKYVKEITAQQKILENHLSDFLLYNAH